MLSDKHLRSTGKHPQILKQHRDRDPNPVREIAKLFDAGPPDVDPGEYPATTIDGAIEAIGIPARLRSHIKSYVEQAIKDNADLMEITGKLRTLGVESEQIRAMVRQIVNLKYRFEVSRDPRLDAQGLFKAERGGRAESGGSEGGTATTVATSGGNDEHAGRVFDPEVALRYHTIKAAAEKKGLKLKGTLRPDHHAGHMDHLERMVAAYKKPKASGVAAYKKPKASGDQGGTPGRDAEGSLSGSDLLESGQESNGRERDADGSSGSGLESSAQDARLAHDVPTAPHALDALRSDTAKLGKMLDGLTLGDDHLKAIADGLRRDMAMINTDPSPQAVAWFDRRVRSFAAFVDGAGGQEVRSSGTSDGNEVKKGGTPLIPTDEIAAGTNATTPVIVKGGVFIRRSDAIVKKEGGAVAGARRSLLQPPMGANQPPQGKGGWEAIPKGRKGGFRRREGDHYVYWYPGMGGGRAPAAAPAPGAGMSPALTAQPSVQPGDPSGRTEHRFDIPEYKLQVIAEASGKKELSHEDIQRARDVAAKLKAGIDKSADICKLNPSVCHGNLGITRDNMPQILDKPIGKMLTSGDESEVKYAKAAIAAGADPNDERSMKDQFLDHLKKSGVAVTNGESEVGKLKATQAEIKAGKTYGMADAFLKGRYRPQDAEIVVSKDGYILDGHHRWAALVTASPEAKMKTIVVDMNMRDMLRESMKFPGVFRADLQGDVVDPKTPLDLNEDDDEKGGGDQNGSGGAKPEGSAIAESGKAGEKTGEGEQKEAESTGVSEKEEGHWPMPGDKGRVMVSKEAHTRYKQGKEESDRLGEAQKQRDSSPFAKHVETAKAAARKLKLPEAKDRVVHAVKHTAAEFPKAGKAAIKLGKGEKIDKHEAEALFNVGIMAGTTALAASTYGVGGAAIAFGQKFAIHAAAHALHKWAARAASGSHLGEAMLHFFSHGAGHAAAEVAGHAAHVALSVGDSDLFKAEGGSAEDQAMSKFIGEVMDELAKYLSEVEKDKEGLKKIEGAEERVHGAVRDGEEEGKEGTDVKKSAWPPAGFVAIPKGTHGGVRKPKSGGGFEYRYPEAQGTQSPMQGAGNQQGKPRGKLRAISRDELRNMLEHGTYSIISAGPNPSDPSERGHAEREPKFRARTRKLIDRVRSQGFDVTLAQGFYDGKEWSLVVHHKTPTDPKAQMAQDSAIVHHKSPSEFAKIRELAKQFNQESVIHADKGKVEMHYLAGRDAGTFLHSGADQSWKWRDYTKDSNYLTAVHAREGGTSAFSLVFDWSDRKPFDAAMFKAELTEEARKKLKRKVFAVPAKRKYPIHDRKHAIAALGFVGMHGTPAEKKQVRSAVHEEYPELGKALYLSMVKAMPDVHIARSGINKNKYTLHGDLVKANVPEFLRMSDNYAELDSGQATVLLDAIAKADPKSERISAKIRLLRHEGYAEDQAAAIAYSMEERGELE